MNTVEEKIMDNNSLEKFSSERIEFGRKVGSFSDSIINVSCKKSNIVTISGDPLSKRFQSLAENIGRWLLNDDETIEVLSRLPIESVLEMKFVCKWWNHLTSRPYFRNAHFQNLQNIVYGIFLQEFMCCHCCDYCLDNEFIGYVGFGEEGKLWVNKGTLNFLPEKVVITASCNGLVICRSLFEREKVRRLLQGEKQNAVDAEPISADAQLSIYVCNPFTKELSILKPDITNQECGGVGFTFHSLEHSSLCFEIVVVHVLKKAKSSFCYMFKIYSSKSETWRVSKEFSIFPYKLFPDRNVVVNGVFYWLTAGHSILAFDLKSEKSEVINLPGPLSKFKIASGMCIGQFEGFLHYIFISQLELRVWILKSDHSKREWVLKSFWYVYGFGKLLDPSTRKDHHNFVGPDCYIPNGGLIPLAYLDDLLFVWHLKRLCAIDLDTGNSRQVSELNSHSYREPLVLSYSRSLLPVCSDLNSSFN